MIKKLFALALMLAAVCFVLPWKGGGVSAAAAGMPPSGTADLRVIDVSKYQGAIQWPMVKPNVDAVYIKATEGSTYTDPNVSSYATAAQNQEIPFGFYDYLWPYADPSNAARQADYFYSVIKNYNYTCVPVLDVEITNSCTPSQITASVLSFATEFKRISGLDVMIYTGPYFANNNLDASQASALSQYKLWIAHYTSNNEPYDTNIWHQWDMWQYTDALSVPGVSGGVDGDRATGNIFVNTPIITFSSYTTNPTNQDITVTASTNKGTLNQTSYTFTQNGSFVFSATDPVTGLTGSRVVEITNIDKTPPVITGVTEGASYTSAVTPVFNEGSATLNGAAFLSGNSVYTRGSYTLTVTDSAGNQTTTHFSITSEVGAGYQGHVQNIGWQDSVVDGADAGTTGRSLRVEALKISLQNAPAGMHIVYRAHVQNIGWQDWVGDGAQAGTTGQGLRVEALQIVLTGTDVDKYSVQYQAHVQGIGWQDWVYDGQAAGTTGMERRVEAVRIRIVPKIPSVTYQSHVQNIGWQGSVPQGAVSGTTGYGLRIEAMNATLRNCPAGMHVIYNAHVQNIGWQGWAIDGGMAGTTGRGLRVEALQMKLSGTDADKYSIRYRAHVQNIGWQDWSSDGGTTGTTGRGLRIEALEIYIVPKG